MSDGATEALTLIVFLGSVFSPYYFRARRRSETPDPLEHSAFNVVLYRPRGRVWTLTERGRRRVEVEPTALRIGPSRIRRTPAEWVIDVEERGVPWPRRVRGQIRVSPGSVFTGEYELDASGHHRWRPIAPCARVEVELSQPDLRWQGRAYLDSNHGDRALEDDHLGWDWSRSDLREGRTAVLYDVQPRSGPDTLLALAFGPDGCVETFEPPPPVPTPRTGWWIRRRARSEGIQRLSRTLEDTPFYARTLFESRILGETATTMHERLDLWRFTQPWVQAMLPFRAPRRA